MRSCKTSYVCDDAEAAVATIAKRFLMDLGVPDLHITVEGRARDTAQNAGFTAAICRQIGFRKPILLTCAYHLKRARMAFTATGMDVIPFSSYFLGSRNTPYFWRHLLPRAGALCASTNALQEYIGILHSRMMGP